MFWLVILAIAAAISVASYVLMPKPKAPAPPSVQQAEGPTASAGMTIPIPFGDITVSGVNTLYFGEGQTQQYKVDI